MLRQLLDIKSTFGVMPSEYIQYIISLCYSKALALLFYSRNLYENLQLVFASFRLCCKPYGLNFLKLGQN